VNPQGTSGRGPVRTASAVATSNLPFSADSRHPAPSGARQGTTAPSGTVGSVTRRSSTHRDADRRLLSVLDRITDRDRMLCRLLDDHRVLTTAQVTDVGFAGGRRARMRLAELYALDILDRFRPRTGGNPVPFHWVLGPLGAALVAAEHGIDPAELDWRRGLVHDLAASQRLAHLVGLNGFFTALIRSARTRPGCVLEQWWSERRCAHEWGELVRPDGYGIWTDQGATLPFLYEHDNGTERLARLAGKLDGYTRLAAEAGHPNWVLFTFPGPRREAEARRVLTHRIVPVATTTRPPGFAPDTAVWLPADRTGPRLRLAQLADLPAGPLTSGR
jgi:hypothetical protein